MTEAVKFQETGGDGLHVCLHHQQARKNVSHISLTYVLINNYDETSLFSFCQRQRRHIDDSKICLLDRTHPSRCPNDTDR